LQDKCPARESSEMKKTKLVTLTGIKKESMHSSSEVIIPLPLPYELPPLPYSSQGRDLSLTFFLVCLSGMTLVTCLLILFPSADIPWSWDRQYNKKDVYGHVWPRMWAYQMTWLFLQPSLPVHVYMCFTWDKGVLFSFHTFCQKNQA